MIFRVAVVLGALWFLLGLVGIALHETRERRSLCLGLALCATVLLFTVAAQWWGLANGRTAAVLVLCLVPIMLFDRHLFPKEN